jgi:ribonuclease H2 subunit B
MKKLEAEEAASLAIAQTNTSKKSKKTDTKDGQKRKSKASQGAEKLKKANVNGMAKISSFFQKT